MIIIFFFNMIKDFYFMKIKIYYYYIKLRFQLRIFDLLKY